MTVPVDGVLLTAMGDVQVDESAMTGESDHFYREIFDRCVQKWKNNEQSANPKYGEHDIPTPLILSGSNVTVGDGWMVIVVVGENTCEGQIMAGLAGKSKGNKLTPLQKKLNTIAEDIGKLGMFCAILIFHALILRNFIEGMVRLDFDLWGGERNAE
jgi:magnesium-transporting ATPase (P-type)